MKCAETTVTTKKHAKEKSYTNKYLKTLHKLLFTVTESNRINTADNFHFLHVPRRPVLTPVIGVTRYLCT